MLVLTTPSIEGKTIVKYLGLVSGEAILGANIFKDFFASIRDIVGGRSAAYEKELQKAKERILRRLTNRWSTLFDYASPLAQAQGWRAAQLLAVRAHCFNHQLAEVNNGISP